jgi:hypothetical protein
MRDAFDLLIAKVNDKIFLDLFLLRIILCSSDGVFNGLLNLHKNMLVYQRLVIPICSMYCF